MSKGKVKVEQYATGKYMVYVDGNRLPVVILGGNGRWIIEYRSVQWPTVRPSKKVAVQDVVNHHAGVEVKF